MKVHFDIARGHLKECPSCGGSGLHERSPDSDFDCIECGGLGEVVATDADLVKAGLWEEEDV